MIPKTNIACAVSASASPSTSDQRISTIIDNKIAGDNTVLKPTSAILNDKNINKHNKDGLTHLMLAAKNGDYKLVQWLIALGADINKSDFEGLHAGWWAARHGHWNIVKYLLQLGLRNLGVFPAAVPNLASEDDGATILWFAACDKEWSMVEELIVRYRVQYLEAAPYSGKYAGVTPLHFACRAGELSCVKQLVLHGAKVNFTDRISPLMSAFSYPDLCDYLIAEAGVYVDDNQTLKITHEFKSTYGESSDLFRVKIASARELFDAVKNERITLALVKMLLINGAHYHQRSILNGNTPLHYAIERQSIKSAKILLEYLSLNFNWDQQHQALSCTNQLGLTPLDLTLKKNSTHERLTEMSLVFLSKIQSLANQATFKVLVLNSVHWSRTPEALLKEFFYKYLNFNGLAKTQVGRRYVSMAIKKAIAKSTRTHQQLMNRKSEVLRPIADPKQKNHLALDRKILFEQKKIELEGEDDKENRVFDEFDTPSAPSLKEVKLSHSSSKGTLSSKPEASLSLKKLR